MKLNSWQISVTLVLILLGIMLSIQFKTQQNLANTLSSQSTEDLVAMWKNLDEKHHSLRLEVMKLESQKEVLNKQFQAGKSNLESIQKEIKKLRMVNGLEKIEGPGITITITGDTELLYLDLVDIVNELRASGAEAIAINSSRVTYSTAIKDTEVERKTYPTLNGERLYYPIIIEAVGDPQTLEKGLTFPGGLIDNLETLYSIYPQIKIEEELILPAVEEPPRWDYAQPLQE